MRSCLIAVTAAWWALSSLSFAAPITHTIEKGETLYSLSRRYAVSVREIQEANPNLEPSKIKLGQTIQIPVKDASPPGIEKPQTASTPSGDKPPADNQKKGTPVIETEKNNPAPPGPTSPNPNSKSENPKPAAPEFHTVAKGDTLFSIARLYSLPMAEFRQLNPSASDVISPGQKLRIRKAGPTTVVIDAGPPPEPNGKPADNTPPEKTEIEKPKPKPTPAPPTPKYVFITGKTKASIDKPKITTRDWRYIVVHHSGTRSGNAKIFDYYHRQVRGMENGLAYHFVIGNGNDSGDGEIEVGDRWLKQLQGGHVRSDAQNEIAIGICLVGDFQRDRPTRRQISSLIELIGYLQNEVGDPEPRLFLHRDINIISTDCPGRNFPAAALYRLFGGQPKRPKD